MTFAYGAVTLYGRPFQTVRLAIDFVTPRRSRSPSRRPHNPGMQRLQAYTYQV